MPSASFVVGIVGNVIAVMLFASPIRTFWRIAKRKSTEDYDGLPYIMTLLSTSIWTFYGLINPDGLLVATVNGAGAAFQIIYLIIFLIYAPVDKKMKTMKMVVVLNIAFVGAVIAIAIPAFHGDRRLVFVGIIGVILSIAMYASPLSIMRTVIRTKSVEYMPFFLSLFQFMTSGIWFTFAILIKDVYIGVPNGTGFLLASAQLVLYAIYKNKSVSAKSVIKNVEEEEFPDNVVDEIIDMSNIIMEEDKVHHSAIHGNS